MAKGKKTAKDRAAQTAAMFAVTSMSTEELSTAVQKDKNFIENQTKEVIDAKIEQQHQEETAEAKAIGLTSEPIFESTAHEVAKDLEQKLEESQVRYLELAEEKESLKKKVAELEAENMRLVRENKVSQQTILSLSSDLNVHKIDTSREIADYKITIDDLRESLEVYKYNENNYKLEISNLRDSLSNLERAIKQNSALSKQFVQRGAPLGSESQMFFNSAQARKMNGPSNGYDAWN